MTKRRLRTSSVPLTGMGDFWRRSRQSFFSEGPKVVQNLEKKFSFKKWHEAHPIDQWSVRSMKMYVGGGGAGQKPPFSLRVKSGENQPPPPPQTDPPPPL